MVNFPFVLQWEEPEEPAHCLISQYCFAPVKVYEL